jgi:hypothetical protein
VLQPGEDDAASAKVGQEPLKIRAKVVVGAHPIVLHRDVPLPPASMSDSRNTPRSVLPDFVVGQDYLVTVSDQDAKRIVPTAVVRNHGVGVD